MTVRDIPISEECSTLAFYEIAQSAKCARVFYEEVGTLLSQLHLPLTLGHMRRNNIKSGWRKSPGFDKKLAKEGFSKITSMTLLSLLPGGTNAMAPYYLNASWLASGRYAYITLRSSLRSLINWKEVADRLSIKLSPAYGIGFRRNCKNYPHFFAIALGGGVDNKERNGITGWGLANRDQVCRAGLLRDVFEWNFLTKPQLDRLIDDLTLKEWIENDTNRGTLSRINNEVTFWEVKMEHQETIFQTLYKAGVIFERDMHRQFIE